jgi:hypothetical protein
LALLTATEIPPLYGKRWETLNWNFPGLASVKIQLIGQTDETILREIEKEGLLENLIL